MLQLRHLEIVRFRTVQPHTRLNFNHGPNILLGKNGTGKTTLLKLIAAAVSVSFYEFQEEEFELSWLMSLGEHELHCTASHRKEAPISGQAAIPRELASLTANAWHARLEMVIWTKGEQSGRVVWRDGQLETERGGMVEQYSTQSSFLMQTGIDFIPAVVLGDLMRRKVGDLLINPDLFTFASTVPRLDESLVWFHHEIVRAAKLTISQLNPAPDLVPSFPQCTGIPSTFFGHIFNQKLVGPPEYLEATSDEQAMLKSACDALGFAHCALRIEFERSEKGSRHLQGVESTLYYGNARFLFTKRDGTRLSHTHLSFGQLRLFAFLYYAELYKGVIIADELTNGLHHAMIELCLMTIRGRQSFLATQNPLLLDHIGFHSAEEAQRTFILCDLIEQAHGQEVMQWRNMSAVEAEEFFGDYEVGIQHVNDILRTRGLW